MNKPRKVQGRLGQCNKAFRLRRRALGQWHPQPSQVKQSAVTRYALAELEWNSGDAP